ncbi:MAG: PAS domain S-box protein [Desulfuromonadales bacterium]|nr:PAS domain S-box protein [Desulfuromonadales bacterium]
MNPEASQLLKSFSFETLMKTIPAGLFLVDTTQNIVYWSEEAARITGYPSSEVVGQHCSFLSGIPCDKGCGLFESSYPKPITGTSCSVQHRNGRRVQISKNIDLLYDNQGQVIGGIEAFVDITRLTELQSNLRAEVEERTQQLKQEQENLRAVLDSMTDLAYICTEDFEISFMNRAMQEYYGPIDGRRCYEVLQTGSGVCDNCPMPQTKQGKIVRQERQLFLTGRSYEIIHSPLIQADGQMRKLGMCRDITERLHTEAELRQANADLDAFVSTVSHDLRSPLTPLIGFAEFLLEQYAEKLDSTAISCLHEIESSGRRMQTLLEDLLTLARVGQIAAPEKPVSLKRVFDEVRQELAVQILRKRAQISASDELPEVRVPESLLVDLLRNLFGNALNYAAATDPRIELEARSLPNRVEIRVIDHGPGVPLSERESIFEPFKRGSAAKLAAGTGIGLATVRKIARLYQGQVRIEETPGGGATFVVDFFHEAQG